NENREVCSGAMERRNDRLESRNTAGCNLRRMQRLRNVQPGRDYIVEQREHNKVEHDRDDDFMCAVLDLEPAGNCADDCTTCHRSHDAERNGENARQMRRQPKSEKSSEKSSRRQLTLGTDVEQPGTDAERYSESGESQCSCLVENLAKAVSIAP